MADEQAPEVTTTGGKSPSPDPPSEHQLERGLKRKHHSRPSLKDFQDFGSMQASVLDKAIESAKVWRNGYAMLAAGSGAVLTLVGDRLAGDTHWGWRLTLTALFGSSIILTALALWRVLTVEGGNRTTTVSLRRIVEDHNSVDGYKADQAAFALERLDRSKPIAGAGAALLLIGLIVALWVPSPDEDDKSPGRAPTPPAQTPKP